MLFNTTQTESTKRVHDGADLSDDYYGAQVRAKRVRVNNQDSYTKHIYETIRLHHKKHDTAAELFMGVCKECCDNVVGTLANIYGYHPMGQHPFTPAAAAVAISLTAEQTFD